MARKELLLQSAEKLVSKGKIEAAIKEYRKVLKKTGDDTNTLNLIGDLYARLRKNDEAISFYGQTAERYSSDGFYVKAIAVYKKIQRLEPGRVEVHAKLAELYQRQGLVQEARNHYQHLSDHYQRQNDAASAITVCQKMVELEPNNPTPRAKLAELYRQERLTSKAAEEYGQIASLMLDHEGGSEQALQVFLRAIDLDPKDLGFLQRGITRLVDAGHLSLAERFLAAAVERNPAAAELRSLLAAGGTAPPAAAEPPTAGPPAAQAPAYEAPQQAVPALQPLALEPMPPPATAAPSLSPAYSAPEMPAHPAATSRLPESLPPAGLPLPPAGPAADGFGAFGGPATAGPSLDPLANAEMPDIDIDVMGGPEMEVSIDGVGEPVSAGAEAFEEFVLDIDAEDEAPSTLVRPPADMLVDTVPGPAWPASTADLSASAGLNDEIEIEIEDPGVAADEWSFEPEPELDAPSLAAPGPEPATYVAPPLEPAPMPSPALSPPPPVAEPLPPAMTGAPSPTRAHTLGPAQPGPTPAAEAARPRPEEDLLAEAEVFVKYGLAEKAIDRLQEVLGLNPSHLGAHAQLIPLLIERGKQDEVARLAASMARVAHTAGGLDVWHETRASLVDQGYGFDGDNLVSVPGAAPPPAAAPAMPPGPAALPTAPSPAAAPPEAAFQTFPGFQDLPVAEPSPLRPPGQAMPGAPAPVAQHAASWLNDVPGTSAAPDGGQESLFEDEEAFFDLAAELQNDLGDDEVATAPEEPREQTVEEIVEGFKRGVAENLSPEDSDTHYNLGIAYREMMLVDEAIGEFQIAAKDPRYLIDCCAMLGQCFTEKGLPELALNWYSRALAVPDIDEKRKLGMLYDTGRLYEAMNDRESAYSTFVQIYGINTNYRDVVAKIHELQPV